mmetsp:Transcript_49377/g.92295  ORF Transcript_49377/g.92295 Transcript_49377/m.92295 type:complete len:289 (+) Transcript_49377:117-983(+)
MLFDSEASIGPQQNSLRPTSARFSFAREARAQPFSGAPGLDSPGPSVYYIPSCLSARSGVIGSAEPSTKPYPYNEDPEAAIPDSSEFRFNAPPRQPFGKEARDYEVFDYDYARAVPEHWHGRVSPGFVYSPDDRRARPSSAPSYSMRSRQSESVYSAASRRGTPVKVAPGSYRSEGSMGTQHDSRRKTARSSSFSRAERFPAPKPREGTVTDECKPVESSFGSQLNSRRHSNPRATFGSSTRESSARVRMSRGVADRPPSGNMSRPRIPHPPVARRQELIKHGSSMPK